MDKKIKILNLYAGIGGNRRLWNDKLVKVTAVEIDEKIAKIYQEFFPNDKVILGDAHKYLLEHYQEYDFIWSSPPCPSHSRVNFSNGGRWDIKYPDMKLYEEIILLKSWFKGKWVVENVISYYEPLINPQVSGRHYFWSNFHITNYKTPKDEIGRMNGIYQKANKKKLIERNAVNSKLGLHIFNCAFKTKQKTIMEIVPEETKEE